MPNRGGCNLLKVYLKLADDKTNLFLYRDSVIRLKFTTSVFLHLGYINKIFVIFVKFCEKRL